MKVKFAILLAMLIMIGLAPGRVFAQTYRCVSGMGGCQTVDNNCSPPHYLPASCGTNVGNCKPAGTYPCDINPADPPANPPANPPPGGGPPPGDEAKSIINLDQLINSVGGNVPQMKSLSAITQRLIPYLLAIAGFGLLIFMILGGFSCLTSAGDPKKLESCKQKITSSLIGFAIVFCAYWVTQIVDYIFKLGSPFS